MGVTTRLLLLATITGVKSYLLNNSHAKVAFSFFMYGVVFFTKFVWWHMNAELPEPQTPRHRHL